MQMFRPSSSATRAQPPQAREQVSQAPPAISAPATQTTQSSQADAALLSTVLARLQVLESQNTLPPSYANDSSLPSLTHSSSSTAPSTGATTPIDPTPDNLEEVKEVLLEQANVILAKEREVQELKVVKASLTNEVQSAASTIESLTHEISSASQVIYGDRVKIGQLEKELSETRGAYKQAMDIRATVGNVNKNVNMMAAQQARAAPLYSYARNKK